jgi:hypothetical protein
VAVIDRKRPSPAAVERVATRPSPAPIETVVRREDIDEDDLIDVESISPIEAPPVEENEEEPKRRRVGEGGVSLKCVDLRKRNIRTSF